jgi:hypothetical protein
MTVPAVYQWNDDYWCEGDIVFYLCDTAPYSAWVDAGHPPGTDETEEELNALARRFRVNRNSDSSVRRHNFPVLIDDVPPGTCCRGCMKFFSIPEDETAGQSGTNPERNDVTTNMDTALTRHAKAMLAPEGPHETTIAALYTELVRLADRYKGDRVMVAAVEHLGAAIIVLTNGEVGRLDQGAIDKTVRDAVRGAGGDEQNL